MELDNAYMWKKKKRCQVFPWMKDVLEKISKSFPNIHESTALQLLHECIEKEFQIIFANKEHERAGNLYVLLSTFFINFCWKMKWKENEKYLNDLAIKLLCYLVYLDSYLYKSDGHSRIDRLLFIFKLLPDTSIIYDSLLLINNLNDKEREFFGLILRYVLCRERLPSISDPVEYIKILLLFRRLKQMIQKNRREAVVFIASAVTQPPDITSWLISLCLEDADNIKDSNVVELLFNKNFSRNNLQILRKAVLSEEHLAWMEKLQNIKTNLLSSSITNIQTAKGRKISKSKGQNKRSEKKCKKDVNKKVKPKGKSSKMKSKTASDDLPKRKRKKAKLHKKEKLSKSDKKESTRKTRKSSKAKLKMLSNNKIKHEISDSRKETKSERFDLDQDKGKKQIASDCENEDQNSMECDSMKKLEPSLSKEECQLNQCTVINSEPSSALSNGVDKPELSTSEGVCKLNLSVLDNNKPSFVESAETVNSINDINESELSSSKAPCQLNLSTVDSFGQYENDLGSSLDVINETELLCLQESCHFTQAVTNDRRNESEMSINMPTIISELDDRQNESVTEIPKSMPVLVPESLENNADDTSCTVGMATVADLIQSEGKDCQADKLIMNSNDYFTTVENYLLDERNFCDVSCSTKASETVQTVEKQFDEKSCQTDELIMNSDEYFMTAGNNILHKENQINASCSANSENALPISENEPYNSNAVENILSQIKLSENFQMNGCLPEIEDSNCMIPPSQSVSYRLLNGTGGLYSNKAIHENLLPSEIERNSNLSTNTQFDASQKHLVESNITTIKQKKILGKINNAISRSSQSSDTDVTEILPIINRGNKNQSTNELHVGRRMLNSKTQILGTNTGIHSQHPLCLNKSNHPLNHSTPAVEGKKTYVSQEHFQHLTPTPGVSTEDTSCLTCELTSTDFDPELVPGHDKKSSSCKRKIPLDKRKRCSKKSHSKPKNNSKDKNSTIINHYNISKTPLTSIDDIIADINKLESNIHASQRCLQSSSYRFQNENKMSKTNNSHSFAELEEEYNCRKENGCNESTNISPSVSDDAGHLNQMMHAHNRLINVYNIVYVDSDTGKDIAASSNLLIGGNMNTSSDKDSSNKNLSGSSVENNAEENIFLMRENANMPNIADVMSSTFHLENNISNSKNFTFNQNLLNGAYNKDNSKIVSHRSTLLSQDANRKTKCNSKPHNVFFNNVVARKLIFQRNSLNSNCQEHDRTKAPESFRSNRNFTYSPELKIKILNTYSTKDFVIHPASQFRVNLGKRLAESEVSSFQKDKMAVLNQHQKGACVDFPMPPRQPTNKFFDGITSDHRKSYPNQSEMNHGIDNESFEETRVNNGNTLNNPKIGESIISNSEIIKETGENNVNCASNSANQTDCPRISADGFTTDGSDFHSPDSSDSSSSLESTHSEKSKKNSQQNLAPSVGDWGKASILKPSKFHIYSCDNDSDTSSDDFVCARKRPAPDNVTEKSKMPLKRRKRTLFNENKQYFLRSRDSVSANKKVTDEIL